MSVLSSPYSIGLYEKALEPGLSWLERLGAAKELGFSFMEISIDETDQRMNRVLERTEDQQIREAVDRTGIPVSTMCLSAHRRFPIGSTKPDIRNKGMDLMKKAIEFSVDMGVRVIQLAGYDVYYDEQSTPESRNLFLENLKISVDWAARAGVMLAFENMGGPYISSVGKAMEFISYIDSPWLQMYADMGNLHAIEADVANELVMAKKHLIGVHIKDTVPGVIRDIPFGKGSTPFEEVFAALAENNYSGFFVVEMWNIKGEDNKQIIRNAMKFIDQKMMVSVK